MKQSIGRFLINFFSVTLFLGVAALAVFFAYGYRLDFQGGSFQKTSIIDISGPRIEADVFLDGEEMVGRLPAQLKNIVPGFHEVTVKKEGFSPWSRLVEVKEDVVSIVKDVLLVPQELGEYTGEILRFEGSEQIFIGRSYLFVREAGKNTIRSIVFRDNGRVTEEEIQLYREDFEVLETYSDQRFLLLFDDGTYAFLNFTDRQFEPFTLPRDAEKIHLEPQGRNVYFLEDGSLFVASFETLESGEYLTLHEDVQDYVVSSRGHVFLVSQGMLYRLNAREGTLSLLDGEPGRIDHLSYFQGSDNGVLALYDSEGAQSLFWVTAEGRLFQIADEVVGNPFVSDAGFVLYVRPEGQLFYYNPARQEERFVRELSGDFQLFGWFDTVGHYLVMREGQLFVADMYNANEFLLIPEATMETVFVEDGALFWLDGDRLMRLFWQE